MPDAGITSSPPGWSQETPLLQAVSWVALATRQSLLEWRAGGPQFQACLKRIAAPDRCAFVVTCLGARGLISECPGEAKGVEQSEDAVLFLAAEGRRAHRLLLDKCNLEEMRLQGRELRCIITNLSMFGAGRKEAMANVSSSHSLPWSWDAGNKHTDAARSRCLSPSVVPDGGVGGILCMSTNQVDTTDQPLIALPSTALQQWWFPAHDTQER